MEIDKIFISEEQRKWLRTLLTWIDTRGIGSRNHPISVPLPSGIVWIREPYDMVFNILLNHHYMPRQKTDLNYLTTAYLYYKKFEYPKMF